MVWLLRFVSGIAVPGAVALALAGKGTRLGNAAMEILSATFCNTGYVDVLAKPYGREVASTLGTVLTSTVLSFGTVSLLLAWFV